MSTANENVNEKPTTEEANVEVEQGNYTNK